MSMQMAEWKEFYTGRGIEKEIKLDCLIEPFATFGARDLCHLICGIYVHQWKYCQRPGN